jgi:AraC-like DNA-binding protein
MSEYLTALRERLNDSENHTLDDLHDMLRLLHEEYNDQLLLHLTKMHPGKKIIPALLHEIMASKRITRRQLATELNLSYDHLSQLLQGKHTICHNTVMHLLHHYPSANFILRHNH